MKLKFLYFAVVAGLSFQSVAQGIYQSPYLYFDEDFTDGKFDDHGSKGKNTRWSLGGFAKFGAVNNRPGIDTAVIRKASDGSGGGWDALIWWGYDDVNTGKTLDIYMDKEEDVQVLKFRAFSDYAGNNVSPSVGCEVAFLEDKAGASFGHDLSFEAQQTWLRQGSPEGPLQLDANVENSSHVYVTGTRFAYHNNNRETSATLDETYWSEVIWRNRVTPDSLPNIEQWGGLNYADYLVDQKMKSVTQPIHPTYLVTNNIQIALFDRINNATSSNSMFRTGYNNSTAQMGIANCSFGVTKRCDFNLDYKIDEADADTLKKYLGRTSGERTIKQGDATNDQKIDIEDARVLTAFMTGNSNRSSVKANYYPQTGNVEVDLENVTLFYIVAPFGAVTNVPTTGSLSPLIVFKNDSLVGFYSNTPITISNLDLGSILIPNLNQSQLSLVSNYKGSGVSKGFIGQMGIQYTLLSSKNSLETNTWNVLGKKYQIPGRVLKIKAKLFASNGQILMEKSGTASDFEHWNPSIETGLKLIQLGSEDETEIFANDKFFKF